MLLPFVSCQYWNVRFLPIIVLFYKVYLKNLDICLQWIISRFWSKKLLEGSSPFLRVLFFFNVSNVFGGGFEVVRESLQSLPHDMYSLYRLISLGISDLVDRSSSVLPIIWRRFFLMTLDFPQLLRMKGDPKLSNGLLHSVSGSLLPDFFPPCLMTDKASTGFWLSQRLPMFLGFSKVLRRNAPRLWTKSR